MTAGSRAFMLVEADIQLLEVVRTQMLLGIRVIRAAALGLTWSARGEFSQVRRRQKGCPKNGRRTKA